MTGPVLFAGDLHSRFCDVRMDGDGVVSRTSMPRGTR